MQISFFLMFLALLFASCERTVDVPSLHEQLKGQWRVEFYTEESYDQSLNSVTRSDTYCRNKSFMNFTTNDQLLVNFDTVAPVIWKYSIVDHRTLDIEGRKWTIEKLDDQQLHLLLNERDTSLKQRNVMGYQLKRP
jgi:hypothetical protein